MLETIREFGLEALAASGEEAATGEWHAQHFAAVAEAVTQRFVPSKQGAQRAQVARVATDLPNLRAASVWALDHGRLAMALRLGTASRSYSDIHRNPGEALRLLAASLAVPGDADPETRVDAMWAVASISWLDHLAPAAALADEAIAAADIEGDRFRAAKARYARAIVAEWTGDFTGAVALCEQGLAVARGLAADSAVGELRAFLTSNLADSTLWLGDVHRAARLAAEGIAWGRATGQPWGTAQGLQTLGAAASAAGDQARAAEIYGEVLAIRRELGDRAGVAGVLAGLAGVVAALGQPERAVRLLGAAESLRSSVGVRYGPHHARGAKVLADVRARMDEPSFAAAWEAGQQLSPEEAVTAARGAIADALAAGATSWRSETRDPAHGLTPRELDVLRLVAEGCSDREIGEALFISHRTVMRHVTGILAKLGVDSRTAAATYAIRHGLV